MEFFLCVLGFVMFVEGLPYAAFPDKIKGWMQMIMTAPEGALRKLGFFLMLTGLILVYIGKQS